MIKFLTIWLIALLIPSVVPASDAMFVGVLEHKYENYPHWPPKDNPIYNYKVRILFYKIDNDWETILDPEKIIKYYPKNVMWTIAFDGRNLGKIESVDDTTSSKYESFYARDKFHNPTTKFPIPKVGNLTSEFTGWPGGETLRPLILSSTGKFADPEKWRPFRPEKKVKHILFDVIKKSIGQVYKVDYDTNKRTPFNYTENDLTISKSYKSASSDQLIQLGFDIPQIDCGGPVEPECKSLWFYLPIVQKPFFIGKKMNLIDAGDYDGDGRSEIVFWKAGYNLDGYILFYDRFTKKVEYLWGYH